MPHPDGSGDLFDHTHGAKVHTRSLPFTAHVYVHVFAVCLFFCFPRTFGCECLHSSDQCHLVVASVSNILNPLCLVDWISKITLYYKLSDPSDLQLEALVVKL